MSKLGRIYTTCRNLPSVFSKETIKNVKNPAYYPNKGLTKILWDNLRDVLKYSAKERGYWMYGFYNKNQEQQKRYVNYSEFMSERNILNKNPRVTFTIGERYNYLCILRDKFVFGRYLSALKIPVVKDYFIIDGRKNTLIDCRKDVLQEEPLENLLKYDFDGFCKILSGECGLGVFPLSVKSGKLGGGKLSKKSQKYDR